MMNLNGFWTEKLRQRIFDSFNDLKEMNKNLQVIGEQLTEMNKQLAKINRDDVGEDV